MNFIKEKRQLNEELEDCRICNHALMRCHGWWRILDWMVAIPKSLSDPNAAEPERKFKQFPIAPAAQPVERGKLLCCLKVEIKAGIYRMLPVHQVILH